MLQYLLNATAVWMLGQLIYFLLLRKETFHTYNRIFLVSSLCAGIIIPLIPLDLNTLASTTVQYAGNLSYSDLSTMGKEANVSQVPVEESPFKMISVLWVIYLAGVLAAFVYHAKDAVILYKLFKNGNKTKQNGYTLVETGTSTTPFSFGKYIFVSSTARYTTQELQIVLAHEQQHVLFQHTLDVLFVNILLIVCWFHPLLYLYRSSLRMVHEYQADGVMRSYASKYGRFLAEQAMLEGAPALTHSLIYSPIKNRIIMLTKKSSKSAQVKKLIALPVALLCLAIFSNCNRSALQKTADAPAINGNVATYRNNTILLEVKKPDTTIVHDSETGEPDTIIHNYAHRGHLR